MRTKTVIAAAVASALSVPIAAFANDAGVMSNSGAVQTQAGSLTFSQQQPAPSAQIAALDSAPQSVTWYYPAGTVVHQESVAIIKLDPSASSGSSQFLSSSSAGWGEEEEFLILSSSPGSSGPTMFVTDAEPNFVIITE